MALVSVLPSACAAPFSDLQSAHTVPPYRVQLTPSISAVWLSYEGERERLQNVLGAQAAVGLLPDMEFRVAFARLDLREGGGLNVLGFGPKFAAIPGHLAVYSPVGFSFGEGDVSETWQWHPTLIFTVQAHRYLEVNPSFKVLTPLTGDPDLDPALAFNLGLGLSNDFGVWALRPEIGVMFEPGEEYLFTAFSLGLSIMPPE